MTRETRHETCVEMHVRSHSTFELGTAHPSIRCPHVHLRQSKAQQCQSAKELTEWIQIITQRAREKSRILL
jgi:hypothetical protein